MKSVSLPSTLENVGDLAFCNCTRLQEVEIKEGLTEIGIWAFAYCSSLKEITLPNSLRSISGGAFRDCRSLQEVVIPMGVSLIGHQYESDYVDWQEYGAFEGCSSLRCITLPRGLEKICQRTFYNCSSLTTVEIPEGVTFIGRDAFSNCSNLVSASLPSTLISCSTTPFAGCNRLAEVRCLALLPPVLSNGLLTLEDMGLALKRTLKVPEWTINRYKLTSGWAAFTQMEPITGWYPSSINVVGDATLSLPTAGLPANYKPEMNIVYRDSYTSMGMLPSSLHLRGNSDFSLDKFVLSTPISSEVGRSQLLNEATMTADTVALSMWISDYYNYDDYYNQQVAWHFFSFPFDVKVSDIVANCDWVIRKYDGKARANNKLESTWVTVPYDSVLHAGQGYIWACTGGEFTVPAMDNANKNLIFANARRDVPLKEYTAEMVSNSSWNLVGNPFPCYYNTNEMDYTAPITVWDTQRNTYAAYSPVDDNYVLSPFEAFFVQCPVGVSSIGFKPEGRQIIGTSSTSSTPMAAPSRTRAEETKRVVVNLTLSNELMADRTRFVINDNAKMDYELSCDAAKFMSSDAAVAQLYTVCGDEKYAINERPMGNGVVKLGTHFAADGTYTIAMESATDMPIVLVDLKTGVETNLATGDYTFQAAAGDNNRFEVRMYADETAVINATKVDVKVVAVGNVIKVSASSDANVELYNTAGSLIAIGRGANVAFDAAQGLYIVKVNGVSHKVAVAK